MTDTWVRGAVLAGVIVWLLGSFAYVASTQTPTPSPTPTATPVPIVRPIKVPVMGDPIVYTTPGNKERLGWVWRRVGPVRDLIIDLVACSGPEPGNIIHLRRAQDVEYDADAKAPHTWCYPGD